MGLFSRKKDDVVVEIEDTEPDVPIIGPWDEADHPEREDRIDAGVFQTERERLRGHPGLSAQRLSGHRPRQ